MRAAMAMEARRGQVERESGQDRVLGGVAGRQGGGGGRGRRPATNRAADLDRNDAEIGRRRASAALSLAESGRGGEGEKVDATGIRDGAQNRRSNAPPTNGMTATAEERRGE